MKKGKVLNSEIASLIVNFSKDLKPQFKNMDGDSGVIFELFGDEIRINSIEDDLYTVSIYTDFYKTPNEDWYDGITSTVEFENIDDLILDYYFDTNFLV